MLNPMAAFWLLYIAMWIGEHLDTLANGLIGLLLVSAAIGFSVLCKGDPCGAASNGPP